MSESEGLTPIGANSARPPERTKWGFRARANKAEAERRERRNELDALLEPEERELAEEARRLLRNHGLRLDEIPQSYLVRRLLLEASRAGSSSSTPLKSLLALRGVALEPPEDPPAKNGKKEDEAWERALKRRDEGGLV